MYTPFKKKICALCSFCFSLSLSLLIEFYALCLKEHAHTYYLCAKLLSSLPPNLPHANKNFLTFSYYKFLGTNDFELRIRDSKFLKNKLLFV